MDLFFMLSGFMLYQVYHRRGISTSKELLLFYGKRMLSLYPLYIVVVVSFLVIPMWRTSLAKTVLTLPVELCLLQSWFPGMFGFAHNGGTWFISCLAFQYLLFPLLLYLSDKGVRQRRMALLWVYVLCATIPFMRIALNLGDVYANQFLRLLQFFSGVLLGAELLNRYERPHRAILWGIAGLVNCVAIVLACTYLTKYEMLLNQYVTYGVITFPLFLLLISSLTIFESALPCGVPGQRLFRILSDHAYAFFLSQFFVWNPIQRLKEHWPLLFSQNGNWKIFLLALVTCTTITVLLQDVYNTPIQRAIRQKLTEHQRKRESI